jgi:Sulfotransferase family
MPIFRHNGEMHFFAHVPKCGGQSVEAYLQARFGTLAFLNNDYLAVPAAQRWTKSSPQHVDRAALAALIPDDWIASSFAVVRHPLARLVSVFNFLSIQHQAIAPGQTAEGWFDQMLAGQNGDAFAIDNHFAAQSTLVPENATVFKLEDGLDQIVAHLDALTGQKSGPRTIKHLNKQLDAPGQDFDATPVSTGFRDRVATHFRADFDRFGYPADPPSLPGVYVARATPSQAPSGRLPGFLRRKTIRSIGGGK